VARVRITESRAAGTRREGYAVSSDDTEDPGLPLTAVDLPKARAELTEWMDPPEFRRRVDGLDKRSRPSSEHFDDPKRQFLHDAWVLAELSNHQPFVRIRLAKVSEEPPDGYAQTETGEVIKIEVTSAWLPGRRLGDEYGLKERIQPDPVENCIKRAESISSALEKAINDKLEKLKYSRPSQFALVVDLTFISDGGMRQGETERAIANIKDRYGPAFRHLWILWKEKVF
jgi:hypothetical protein